METSGALIIGGGVIGLSLARELASMGVQVTVVERGDFGREASWAGAGILPPASRAAAIHPYDQLRVLSNELHPRWAEQLLAETGIDNGFRRCGGIYVATSPGESAALRGILDLWHDEGVAIEALSRDELAALEPNLIAMQPGSIRAAYHVPDECQLRNPRHLQALIVSCRQRGVRLIDHCEVLNVRFPSKQSVNLETTCGRLDGEQVCVTGGAWTQSLLRKLQVATGIFPVRGQMVLFACEQPPITHIINEGSRYLVPREDGFVLAGSTEEEAGFCKQTTDVAIRELIDFAVRLVPRLHHAGVERTWAGLRPATLDGFPYLGRVPGFDHLYVAAGHFRSGLYLSPATAVLMAQLMRGEKPAIDLSPFSVLRN